MTLADKTVLVTGGSLGIGRAIVHLCAQEGARVLLVARHEGPLRKTLSELDGRGHMLFSCDVSDPAQVERLVGEVAGRFERLDGLVNCAGVLGPIGPVADIDPQDFARTWNINLLGTFLMCRGFLPALMKSPRGKIINVSGGGATGAFPFFSAYAASKAAVVRFTENIAQEYKEFPLDINSVSPGFVVTRLHEQTLAAGQRAGREYFERTKQQVAAGGVPAEKAAALTAFLLSDRSNGISGKLISAQWDPWHDETFQARLKREPDLATLRRIDDINFVEKT